jgi:hypothetical protein
LGAVGGSPGDCREGEGRGGEGGVGVGVLRGKKVHCRQESERFALRPMSRLIALLYNSPDRLCDFARMNECINERMLSERAIWTICGA